MGFQSKQKAKSILPNIRTLKVESPSATIEVKYSFKWLSTKEGKAASERLRQAQDSEARLAAFIEFAPQLLTEWDATDDEGKPLALSKETFEDLPEDWLVVLFHELSSDLHQIRQQFEAKVGQRHGRAVGRFH